ncbi:MAG: alpha-amylase family glycosyl hydrolase [Planctomycetota bacterium]
MELRSPKGAQLVTPDSVLFEVWSPIAESVDVEVVRQAEDQTAASVRYPMTQHSDHVWSLQVEGIGAGTLYRYSVNGQPGRPDPRSRFQPDGVHGPSQVIDDSFPWTDHDWPGVQKYDLVIYELHVGSFTPVGTYLAAIEQLDALVELGITAIEVLPLAQSPGRWNWGYDGVNYFAPRNTFGTPEELKALVDACHGKGIAVINDVVYNHVGPEGNYLSTFGPYRSAKRGTPWGDAFNFDGPGREQVRRYVIDNIKYWINEYHLDGVRLDAVHYMFDDSDHHILDEIRDEFRQLQRSMDRQIYLIGESNIYDPHLVGDVDQNQPHHDAVWSDCLMHSIYSVGDPELRLTNRLYQPLDLAEAIEHGYVFSTPNAIRVDASIRQSNHQGNISKKYLSSLITALQTHDSVGNHPHGKRLHQLTSLEFFKSAVPLILLYPTIPMLFMGEEIATDSPFPFFADFEDTGLRKAVDQGRRDEYPHHDWEGSPLPSDPLAFTTTRPCQGNAEIRNWYRSLLRLRREGIHQWLSPDRLVTSADSARHVYRLTYQHESESITIISRLDQPDADPIEISSLLDSGSVNVLLDSQSSGKQTDMLKPQHALVLRTSD